MTRKIDIPRALLPLDGRFGSGPTKVRQEAVERLTRSASGYLGTSHRRPAARQTVHRIKEGLAELFSLPDGYEVALGNGGASAFWDMAALGLIERRSQHLAFGEFSSRFAAIVARMPHLEDPVVIESAPGRHPVPEPDPDVDLYALTHNETSTGVSMQIRRPGPGIVAVDGTSAAGAIEVSIRETDAYYFSPQKAFGSDGGLWLALLSPLAIERIESIGASGRFIPSFLDLGNAVANSRLDQTYNTPALATLYLLDSQIGWMLDQGGLPWAAEHCRSMSSRLYSWAEKVRYASPFVQDGAMRSPVTVTVDLEVDAGVVSGVLRDNGIVDTESYRKLGRNQLRIGVWPATDPDDVERLIACIDYVVERL
jgi:phosphoserine aminotransferase